jgi:hypothetical protein
MEQFFSLIPFPDPPIPEIQIRGRLSRQANILKICYSLTGNIETLIIPRISNAPKRRDELWKVTCFECFICQPDDPQYWEFNMSPSGDWNVYRMDGYRRLGFREETSIQQLTVSVRREPGCLSAEANVDLGPIISEESPIQVAIASIVHSGDGQETYWALTHPNPQPDFHLRESFTLVLAE